MTRFIKRRLNPEVPKMVSNNNPLQTESRKMLEKLINRKC